jgi:hypothetical protein
MIEYPYDLLRNFCHRYITVLIFAIFSAWPYFLIYTLMCFKRVPKLESANEQQKGCAVFNSAYNRYIK